MMPDRGHLPPELEAMVGLESGRYFSNYTESSIKSPEIMSMFTVFSMTGGICRIRCSSGCCDNELMAEALFVKLRQLRGRAILNVALLHFRLTTPCFRAIHQKSFRRHKEKRKTTSEPSSIPPSPLSYPAGNPPDYYNRINPHFI